MTKRDDLHAALSEQQLLHERALDDLAPFRKRILGIRNKVGVDNPLNEDERKILDTCLRFILISLKSREHIGQINDRLKEEDKNADP